MKNCNNFWIEEVINNYCNEFAGSIQNKSHSKALEYAEKVESLREGASKSLGLLDSHYLTFQHNQYYIEKLIFNFLKIDKNWTIFTDEKNNENFKITNSIYSLEELKEENLNFFENQKVLVWISELSNWDEQLFRVINNLKKGIKFPFYSYLSISTIFNNSLKNKELLKDFSFISLDSSFLLEEYGSHFFWFNKNYLISPIFMGSNAAKLSSENDISIKEMPHSLEIGTSNLISLIVLERFFYHLQKREESLPN